MKTKHFFRSTVILNKFMLNLSLYYIMSKHDKRKDLMKKKTRNITMDRVFRVLEFVNSALKIICIGLNIIKPG